MKRQPNGWENGPATERNFGHRVMRMGVAAVSKGLFYARRLIEAFGVESDRFDFDFDFDFAWCCRAKRCCEVGRSMRANQLWYTMCPASIAPRAGTACVADDKVL